MTASPQRPSSQRVETVTHRERLSPVPVSPHTLPPTLIKLRNLNATRPPTTSVVSGCEEVPTAIVPSVEAAKMATIAPESRSNTEGSTDSSPRRGLLSRITSQSLVLLVILFIAVTGIVAGNRGTEESTRQTASNGEPLDAQLAQAEAAVASFGEQNGTPFVQQTVTQQDENVTPDTISHSPASMESAAMGLAVSDTSANASISQPIDDNSTTTSTDENPVLANTTPEQPQSPVGATSTLGTPELDQAIASISAPTVDAPDATSGITAADSAGVAPKATKADLVAHAENTKPVYAKTETPAGVDDWSRYLPGNGPTNESNSDVRQTAAQQPIASNAVAPNVISTKTPQSPIDRYQQYLNTTSAELAPANSGTTASSPGVYENGSLSEQTQVPGYSIPTQQR